MYRDTDSLFYEFQTDDIYQDLLQLKHIIDLSDYAKDHRLHRDLNEKMPLELSDLLKGDILSDAVFLKPKSLLSKNYANSQTECQNFEQTCEEDNSS